MKKTILLIALIGLNSAIYSQTKIGFNINDAFDVSGNSVAHYGMSRISGTGYHYVGLSGYFGLNFYTQGEERIKVLGNGNVGLATSNPKSRLHIYRGESGGNPHVFSSLTVEDSNNSMISILTPNNKTAYFGFSDSEDGFVGGMQYEHFNDRLIFRTNNHASDLVINNNGNVGIGTTSPNATLQVGNSNNSGSPFMEVEMKRLSLAPVTHSGSDWFFTTRDNNPYANLDIGYGNYKSLTLRHDGNVGIGTPNPGIWKLAVNGKIKTKEIKVTLDGWSDFVFEKNYDLPTLKEVEKHIKENGHLKDIPSATEVEENGIFLGEMDSKLLQKIEELTLYTIKQQKEIEILKEEKEELKSVNKKLLELQKRLEKLENK